MAAETYSYRGYEIPITQHPTFWEAEMYPAADGLPAIDWTSKPIRAASQRETKLMAMQRIDDALK